MTYTYEVWLLDGSLAYVGITDRLDERFRAHARRSDWFDLNAIERIEATKWPDRTSARMMESCVINEQAPRFNVDPALGTYRRAQDYEFPAPIARFNLTFEDEVAQ